MLSWSQAFISLSPRGTALLRMYLQVNCLQKPRKRVHPKRPLTLFVFAPALYPQSPPPASMTTRSLNPTPPPPHLCTVLAAGPIYHFNSNNNTISDSWTGDYFLNSSLCELPLFGNGGKKTPQTERCIFVLVDRSSCAASRYATPRHRVFVSLPPGSTPRRFFWVSSLKKG